jgi:DNA-binding CsgD family transcriptional regulator
MAGQAPPCSRLSRITLGLKEGFRVDHDDYTDQEIAYDPFYQEFQLPRGLYWNAVAKLDSGPDDWGIELSFKRDFKAGPFAPQERAVLNSVLPRLRAASRTARWVLDAEMKGMGRLLQLRGDPVVEFDAWGNVLRTHGFDSNSDLPVSLLGRRLVAADRLAQTTLDLAIAAAVTPPQRPALARLSSRDGDAHYLQVVPVVGKARDVFLAAAAIATLISPLRQQLPLLHPNTIRNAFALTDTEAAVAAMLGQGLRLDEIARRLNVQIGTVRNHLKGVFQKTGTTRQAQLTALLGRLRP